MMLGMILEIFVLIFWILSCGFFCRRKCKCSKWKVYWRSGEYVPKKFYHKSNFKKKNNTYYVEVSPFLACFGIAFGGFHSINKCDWSWCCFTANL